MRRLKVFFALAIICALFTGLAAPVSATEAVEAPAVRFWAFHDKHPDGWPNGWTGADGPAISSYLWDDAWDWGYGAPSYVLFRVVGSSLTPQQVVAGGTLVSRGYLPSDMKLALPGDGQYAVVLLPPDVISPTGTPWRISSDDLQFITVYQGQVNVQQAVSGRWTGDQALVGIINSRLDPCNPTLRTSGMMMDIFLKVDGDGFTGDSYYDLYIGLGEAPEVFENVITIPTEPDGTTWFGIRTTQPLVVYARDLGCGLESNRLLIPAMPLPR